MVGGSGGARRGPGRAGRRRPRRRRPAGAAGLLRDGARVDEDGGVSVRVAVPRLLPALPEVRVGAKSALGARRWLSAGRPRSSSSPALPALLLAGLISLQLLAAGYALTLADGAAEAGALALAAGRSAAAAAREALPGWARDASRLGLRRRGDRPPPPAIALLRAGGPPRRHLQPPGSGPRRMRAQVIAASWLGGAAGSLELAAALAVARRPGGTGPRRRARC